MAIKITGVLKGDRRQTLYKQLEVAKLIKNFLVSEGFEFEIKISMLGREQYVTLDQYEEECDRRHA